MQPLRLAVTGTLVLAAALAASCASTAADQGASSESPSAASARSVLAGSFVDTEGQTHNLGDVLSTGKPVALVFWQPWCGACIAEAPTVIAAHGRFGSDMTFFGVVSGPDDAVDEADVARAMLETGMTYPTLRDRDLRLTDGLAIEYQPHFVIVEPDGTVAYKAEALPAEWH